MTDLFVDLHAALPWLRGQYVHVVPAARYDELASALQSSGFSTLVIRGREVRDSPSLFAELAPHLPDHFGHNWDALADALGDAWDGVGRLAVLWTDVDQSMAGDLQMVMDAVRLFDDTASGAMAWDDDGQTATIEIFLIGAGPGFGS